MTVEDDKIVLNTSALISDDIDAANSDTAWDIWDQVRKFIDTINGTAKVADISMKPVVLNNIKFQDPEGQIKYLKRIVRLDAFLEVPTSGKFDFSKLIPLSIKNKSVAKALRLYSHELDWVNMVRIYDVILEDVGSLKNKNYEILKRTANNAAVVGDLARHGQLNWKAPKKKTVQMSGARLMLKAGLLEWIAKKLAR